MILTPPIKISEIKLDLKEYMTVQYLPVKMAGSDLIKLPPNLECLREMIMQTEFELDEIVYVTAKYRYVSPTVSMNRGGWHIDAFGEEGDKNYLWCDSYPTRYVLGEIPEIKDHRESMAFFEGFAMGRRHYFCQPNTLYRLDQSCLHATQDIPEAGYRQFVKISVSKKQYNLKGNAHNYLFDYDWKLYDREKLRNDPINGNSDSFKN